MFSTPDKLLETYWYNYGDRLSGKYQNPSSFVDDVKGMDPDIAEGMAEYLYNDRYANQMSRDEFDQKAGLQEWRDAQPTWTDTIGENMKARLVDLGAGLVDTIDHAANWLESKVPLGAINIDQWPPRHVSSEEAGGDILFNEETSAAMRKSADEMELEDRVTWDEFKESPVTQFIPFALEHGLVSLPDMIAAVTSLPVYVAARTGDIGHERAQNDMREKATTQDLLRALPAAVVSSALEKIGASRVFGLNSELAEVSAKEIGKEVGRRAGKESATEALQEPVEQVGASADTERWKRMSGKEIAGELLEASAQGAVVGAGFGGAASIPALSVQAARHRQRVAGGGGPDAGTRPPPASGEPEPGPEPDTGPVMPPDLQEATDQASENVRKAAEDSMAEPEAAPEPTPAPEAEAEVEEDVEVEAEVAAVDQAEEAESEVAPAMPSDEERSVESMQLEEEANLGKRVVLRPTELQMNDSVVVDDGMEPTPGRVIELKNGVARIVDAEGETLAVLRLDRPLPADPIIYSAIEGAEEERDVELEGAVDEIGRLIKRTAEDPDDDTAAEGLRKIRDGDEFSKLPAESRDRVDNHLRDLDKRAKKREKDAETKAAAEKEKSTADQQFSKDVMASGKDIDPKAADDIINAELKKIGPTAGLNDVPAEKRPEFLSNIQKAMGVAKTVPEGAPAPEPEPEPAPEAPAEPEPTAEEKKARKLKGLEIGRAKNKALQLAKVVDADEDFEGTGHAKTVQDLWDHLKENYGDSASGLFMQMFEAGREAQGDEIVERNLTRSESNEQASQEDKEADKVADANAFIQGMIGASYEILEEADGETDTEAVTEPESAPEPAEEPKPEPIAVKKATKKKGSQQKDYTAKVGEDRTHLVLLSDTVEERQSTGPKKLDIQVRYGVVELDDIIISHTANFKINPDYPSMTGQPRKRSARTNRDQVLGMSGEGDAQGKGRGAFNVRKMEPNYEAGSGTPLLGKDLAAESGNGRLIAATIVHDRNGRKAQEYRENVVYKWADQNGFGDQVRAMKKPILVSIRVDDQPRRDVAVDVNVSDIASYSPSEQANLDAEIIGGLKVIGTESVQEITDKFIASLSEGERSGLVVTDARSGKQEATAAADIRVANAIMAEGWNSENLNRVAMETGSEGIMRVVKGFRNTAHRAAKVKLAEGDLEPIIDGLDFYLFSKKSAFKSHDFSVANLLNQAWVENPIPKEDAHKYKLNDKGFIELPKITDTLARLLDTAKSEKRVTAVLDAALDELERRGNEDTGGDLLGGREDVPLEKVMQDAFEGKYLKAPMKSSEEDMQREKEWYEKQGEQHPDLDEEQKDALLFDMQQEKTEEAPILDDLGYKQHVELAPIGPGNPEFDAWFKGSKVAEADGSPEIVYHGTPSIERFQKFDPDRKGYNWGDHAGYFFIDDFEAAWQVADGAAFQTEESPLTGEGRVSEVYLSIKNPMYIDTDYEHPIHYWDDGPNSRWVSEALKAGHDGIILKEETWGGLTMYVAFESDQIRSAEPDGKFMVEYRTPGQVARDLAPNLRDEVSAIAKRIVPSANVELIDATTVVPTNTGRVTGDMAMKNGTAIIRVAMYGRPRQVLRHEAIHALKAMGLFTENEWTGLVKAAERGKWIKKHRIAERYPAMIDKDGNPTDDAIEEAIADEFAAWAEGGKGKRAKYIVRVFERIMQFFRDLTALLRGHGVTPMADNIFDAVERGEVGARQGRGRRTGFKKARAQADFEEWHKGSKVKGAVYHGTASPVRFAEFDPKKKGDNFEDHTGFFFTNSKDAAMDYAFEHGYRALWDSDLPDRPRASKAWLSIKNPLILKSQEIKPFAQDPTTDPAEWWWGEGRHEIHGRDLKAEGYDGIIIVGQDKGQGIRAKARVYIAFEPDQIRSAEPDWKFMVEIDPDARLDMERVRDLALTEIGSASLSGLPEFEDYLLQFSDAELSRNAEHLLFVFEKYAAAKEKIAAYTEYERERTLYPEYRRIVGYIKSMASDRASQNDLERREARHRRFDPDYRMQTPEKRARIKGQLKERQESGIGASIRQQIEGRRERMSQMGYKQHVEFADPDTEARWQEATKGINPTAVSRVSDALAEEWRRMTNAREHLPATPEFSDAREKLVHLEQAEHAAKEKIAALFNRVMGKIAPEDVDLLTRKMVLDDLLWTSEEGMALPFGLKGPEDVLANLQEIEAVLETRPDLQRRLFDRTHVRDELREQMVSTGVLTPRQARNPQYFRHQVLEYAALRSNTGSGRARKVRSTYWHSRRGSEKDINANYFQAEADWMYKAHQDVATAKFLGWLRTSKYNAKRTLARRARHENMVRIGAMAMSSPNFATAWDKRNKNIAISMSSLRKELEAEHKRNNVYELVPRRLRRQLRAFLDDGAGNKAVGNETGNSGFFSMVQWLADSDIEGVNQKAGMVLGAVYNRRKFIKESLGEDYVNPQNARELAERYLPETHTVWQANSFDGKTRAVHIFTGKTVTEHVLDKAMDNLRNVVGRTLTKEQYEGLRDLLANQRDVRMLGGPMEEMIVPVELAATLNEFYDKDVTGAVDALAVLITSKWKQWTLFNPARFSKYYLNNMTGDTDALLATRAGKGVASMLPQAFREVKRMIYNSEISPELNEALEKGVVQSSLVMQEVSSAGSHLTEDVFRPSRLKGALKVGVKYFQGVMDFARLRENAFRYAAYLHYKKEFAAGKSLEEIGYGASPPWMVRGISNRNDAAARMARDLLGDYGSIPYRAKWARKRLIPFVSWIASNTTRYINLFRNAYLTGRDVSASKGVAMGAYAGGGLMVRMFILYAAVQVWNNLLFGDDEELRGTEERLRLHANLGRWGDEVVTLRFQGALSDFLGWFGLEDAGAAFMEIQRGRAGPLDVAGALAKAPVNRIVGGVTPLYKLPIELGLGKVFFPDVFNPRAIRDRGRHAARTFSLDYPVAQVKRALGESAPVRDPLKTLASAVVYIKDPGQMAYDQIRGKAFEFIKHETGTNLGGRYGERSQALYNLRQSRKLGDEASERSAFRTLREFRATPSSVKQSIKRASPLGMFPNKALRAKFLRSLTPRERDTLKRGTKWYNLTFR